MESHRRTSDTQSLAYMTVCGAYVLKRVGWGFKAKSSMNRHGRDLHPAFPGSGTPAAPLGTLGAVVGRRRLLQFTAERAGRDLNPRPPTHLVPRRYREMHIAWRSAKLSNQPKRRERPVERMPASVTLAATYS
jgi:hypothetical protein